MGSFQTSVEKKLCLNKELSSSIILISRKVENLSKSDYVINPGTIMYLIPAWAASQVWLVKSLLPNTFQPCLRLVCGNQTQCWSLATIGNYPCWYYLCLILFCFICVYVLCYVVSFEVLHLFGTHFQRVQGLQWACEWLKREWCTKSYEFQKCEKNFIPHWEFLRNK